jgi:hypothetical protein
VKLSDPHLEFLLGPRISDFIQKPSGSLDVYWLTIFANRFPHVNDVASADELGQQFLRKLGLMWLGAFGVLGGAIGLSFMLWRRLV